MPETMEEVQAPALDLKEAVSSAQNKDELAEIATKLGTTIDGRMSIENIKKELIKTYNGKVSESERITKESVEKTTDDKDPLVRMKFSIMDILNPDEAPLFEFCNDCGRGVKRGDVIPKWSFMHGQTYTVPYSIYAFLKECTIPRSKYVKDEGSPSGFKTVIFQQKRFNCELDLSREQVLGLKKKTA